ncbi:hypothetical protein D3C74_501190 [compost metagenome]
MDLEWKDHVLVAARIHASRDGECRLVYPQGLKIQLPDGSLVGTEHPLTVKAGEAYFVTV